MRRAVFLLLNRRLFKNRRFSKCLKNYRTFETEVAGRKLVIEVGKLAQLATGSCLGKVWRDCGAVHCYNVGKAERGCRLLPAFR